MESAVPAEQLRLRSLSRTNLFALFDALLESYEAGCLPSVEVCRVTVNLLVRLLTKKRGKSQGRHGKLLQQAQDHAMHLTRFKCVEIVRSFQRGPPAATTAEDAPLLESMYAQVCELGGPGRGTEDASAYAACLLHGTTLAISDEALRKIHMKVRKGLGNGSFYLPGRDLSCELLNLLPPMGALVNSLLPGARNQQPGALDGRPSIPAEFIFFMASPSRPQDSRRLKLLEQWNSYDRSIELGSVVAIVNMLYLIARYPDGFARANQEEAASRLLTRQTIALLRHLLLNREGRTRGSTGNLLALEQSNFHHLMRHFEVERQLAFRTERSRILNDPLLDGQPLSLSLKAHLLLGKMFGVTDTQIYRIAAHFSSRSPWRGSADAFEDSFRIVEAAPWLQAFYVQVQPEVATTLGVSSWFDKGDVDDPFVEAEDLVHQIAEWDADRIWDMESADPEFDPRAAMKRLRELSRMFNASSRPKAGSRIRQAETR